MTQETALQRIRQAKETNAETLDLSNLGLESLPAELWELTNLKKLSLFSNNLTALPNEIRQLADLVSLNLSDNQLATLPSDIFQLTQLKDIRLWVNKLTDLPPAIGKLVNLKTLYLADNQLATLPPEIFGLVQLKVLYLSENKLTDLSPEIEKLVNLETLSLNENQLAALPREILNLRFLKELGLHNTPLSSIALPVELLYGDAQQILSFYKKLWEEGGRPLGEARVLVVGQPSVGKTSLVRRLIDGEFNEKEDSTMTVNMRVLPTGASKALVWDFGGQEYMHATHPFFFSQRCLYLLVINVRDEKDQNRLEYWLQTIRSYGADSPVIVVANKADKNGHPMDIRQRQLKREYPNIQAFIETSAQDNLGIEDLRAAIVAQMEAMPQVRVELPVSYLAVKETLDAEKQIKNIVSLERYAELCEQNGVTDKRDQANVLNLLHDMGTVFCFKDEKGEPVSEVGILNPNWVTQGVYKVLTSEKIRAGVKGKLTTKALDEILSDYEARHRRLIADLMKRFELCYQADDSTYWLPNAMEKDEPAELGDWASALTFEYQYPELPESVVTRFIVKTHLWIQKVWRYGVILQKDGNSALVQADTDKKRVAIKITGRENTRRDLLAQLRGHFDEIHKPFAEAPPAFIYPPQYPELPIAFEKLKTFERDNVPEFHETYKDKTVTINVRETLDGFSTPAERQKERDLSPREVHYHDHKHIEVGRDVVGGVLNMGDENQITQTVTHAAELKESMDALVKETQAVLNRLEASEEKEELQDNLERLQSEMQKSKPNEKWYRVSIEGLIKAAENLDKLGKPVIGLAGKVLKLLIGAA